jgi:hypothetical protein
LPATTHSKLFRFPNPSQERKKKQFFTFQDSSISSSVSRWNFSATDTEESSARVKENKEENCERRKLFVFDNFSFDELFVCGRAKKKKFVGRKV